MTRMMMAVRWGGRAACILLPNKAAPRNGRRLTNAESVLMSCHGDLWVSLSFNLGCVIESVWSRMKLTVVVVALDAGGGGGVGF